jgi:hypothetical protein
MRSDGPFFMHSSRPLPGKAMHVRPHTTARNEYGELSLLFPGTRSPSERTGNYQFWQCWGIQADENELVSRMRAVGHVNECALVQPEKALSGEDPYAAARRLLAEVLGLFPPNRSWSLPNKAAGSGPARGEIVEVAFGDGAAPVPCVVISTEAFNNQHLDAVVVLQCIRYEEGDDEDPQLIPLGPDGHLAGLGGRWSIDVALVRAIFKASRYVWRRMSPIRLDKIDLARFNDLREVLEKLYA